MPNLCFGALFSLFCCGSHYFIFYVAWASVCCMGSHSFVHPMMGISDFSDFKIISKGVVRIYIKKDNFRSNIQKD